MFFFKIDYKTQFSSNLTLEDEIKKKITQVNTS